MINTVSENILDFMKVWIKYISKINPHISCQKPWDAHYNLNHNIKFNNQTYSLLPYTQNKKLQYKEYQEADGDDYGVIQKVYVEGWPHLHYEESTEGKWANSVLSLNSGDTFEVAAVVEKKKWRFNNQVR